MSPPCTMDRALQEVDRLRAQQAVGVGDQADAHAAGLAGGMPGQNAASTRPAT